MENKILVVEDELIIAYDIKEILENIGYEAIINITSVEQAIEIIENEKPILVLIDINLKQDKDGTHLGQYLLKRDDIPYIYLTSYYDQETVYQVNNTRPHAYLLKPFKEEELKVTISVVLNNFFHQKIDTKRNEKNTKDPIPYKIRKIVDYINENIEKKIEVKELAELTEWKVDHFIRLFSKYLKMTPYQYILDKKIEKSKILLSSTDYPINQIAFEIGFESQSSFYHAFKKSENETPENYRKRNKEK